MDAPNVWALSLLDSFFFFLHIHNVLASPFTLDVSKMLLLTAPVSGGPCRTAHACYTHSRTASNAAPLATLYPQQSCTTSNLAVLEPTARSQAQVESIQQTSRQIGTAAGEQSGTWDEQFVLLTSRPALPDPVYVVHEIWDGPRKSLSVLPYDGLKMPRLKEPGQPGAEWAICVQVAVGSSLGTTVVLWAGSPPLNNEQGTTLILMTVKLGGGVGGGGGVLEKLKQMLGF